MIGSAVNYFGDRLLGFKMELWTGLSYFGGSLLLDVFVVPFVSGLAVASVFGHGSKWLCYFPPMIVRAIAYIQLAVLGPIPAGTLADELHPLVLLRDPGGRGGGLRRRAGRGLHRAHLLAPGGRARAPTRCARRPARRPAGAREDHEP